MGYQTGKFAGKGQVLAEDLGPGQVQITHLDPALFLQVKSLNTHNHGGIDSTQLNGATAILPRTITATQIALNTITSNELANSSVIATTIANGAIFLGGGSITANATNTNTSATAVAGLTTTVTVPSNSRYIKVTAFTKNLSQDGGGGANKTTFMTIWDGTVGVGTQIAEANYQVITGTDGVPATAIAVYQASAGSHTYNVGLHSNGAGATNTIAAAATSPAFIIAEAI